MEDKNAFQVMILLKVISIKGKMEAMLHALKKSSHQRRKT
jgi:hypothetical protein